VIEANAPSGLLSPEENRKIWEILQQSHKKNQALAVAVVKLYLSDPSEDHKVWVERVAGAACFTKDYGRKSYYIQIFDMQYHQQVWEQEIYMEMIYSAPQAWFHSFEADNSMVGLSFADEREGQNFLAVVQGKIEQRRAKKIPGGPQMSVGHPINTKQMTSSPKLQNKPKPVKEVQPSPKSSKKKKDTKKFSKLDISGPDTSSFIHVTGVKSDGSGGMRMVDNSHLIDPVLKKYLTIAGIDASSLGAQEIEQVKKFAEKENLYEQVERRRTVKREQKKQNKTSDRGGPPPPPYQRSAPPRAPLPSIEEQRGTPPIPARTPSRPVKPPPTIPNCPPPTRKPSMPNQGRKNPTNGPPPPPSGGGPPPPPPPPGPGLPPASATPRLPSNPKPSKGDLLGEIQNFAGGLKKTDPHASSKRDAAPVKGDFLSQIRSGVKLREVDENEVNDRSSNSVKSEEGLMGALKGALANIHEANFSSSEDESDDDDDDWGNEDWDDESTA